MAQPTPYVRQFDFTDFSTDFPTTPHQGNKLDLEYDAIKETLDETLANLALIQRDDGALANDSVGLNQLTDAVQAYLTTADPYRAPYFEPTDDEIPPTAGMYLSGAASLALAATAALALLIANPASAVNYVKISGAATGNYPYIEALGSNAEVGMDYKTKGTTTTGGQFNGAAAETSGRHRFFIDGRSVLELTDTYWNPNVSYTDPPVGKVVVSSGADTGAATTDVIAGVISVESDEYGELGSNGFTIDGLTLMLGAKGPTGSIHFLNNGLVGHVSIAAPANAAGDDEYAACNSLWLRGSQQGASQNPVIFTNGETGVGLTFYTGSGVGYTTFLGHNTATSLLQLRPASTSAIHGFYMLASATGAAPLLGVGTFNGYTSADTNLGLSLSSRGTGAVKLYSHDGAAQQFSVEGVASAVNYISCRGAVTGIGVQMQASGTDTNISFYHSTKGTGLHYFYSHDVGALQFAIQGIASAVNYLSVFGSTTGNAAGFSAQGSDTDIGVSLSTKGAGSFLIYTGNFGRAGFGVINAGSSVNYLTTTPGATGVGVTVAPAGSDTDISLYFSAKGAGGMNFYTASSGALQLQLAHTASAVNYIIISGNIASNPPTLYLGGSDTNIALRFSTKGTGSTLFYSGTLNRIKLQLLDVASSVNYFTISPAATGAGPVLAAIGSDANIDVSITPKGSGLVRLGTHSGIAAETVTGYITIKDSGGTSRKLAVVS